MASNIRPAMNSRLADMRVLRERAGLVGANDRGAAERFDGGQMADQRVAFRHALRAHRERQRDGREQPLRHVRHDDADGENEVLPKRQPDRADR